MGWKDIFGPSREEVWRQLCQEIGGDFVDGGFWKGDKIQVRSGVWTITLDTYTVPAGHAHIPYTRMRAPFVSRDGFRFLIYRKGLFSGLGKMLGMQDIETGQSARFDEDFIIQGNDESKVRALFVNSEIRRLIDEQPEIRLELKDDEGTFRKIFPEGVDELEFTAQGIIKDVVRLKRLYDLFAEVLDQLTRIGSAAETDPGVRL
ncbi:MAG TPA: DUF3137 domain-containing protein [Thermoanaerobaculia bacterium]|nr:DUF3137 domain-containing protein [Thermoanaerobaculia bacterium]